MFTGVKKRCGRDPRVHGLSDTGLDMGNARQTSEIEKNSGGVTEGNLAAQARRISRADVGRLAALAAVVTVAVAMRIVNLAALGDANHYYAAAVASMLKSWHNFFFVAAEPGASVSVDKPPLGFWLQALSAYFLGVNGPALLLPEILAGIASVIVLYHLVRRSFGTVAGLLAGLALAITPVVVATDRNNTIDSTLILTLLLAAWGFIKATETGRLRFLLLGAALVGIGFNIKMLQAYLPLPAFVVLYFLGSAEALRQKVWKLALAGALLLVISLSWVLAVDLTPASARPYVGSSGDNSEVSLLLVYNGVDRLVGMFGRPGSAPGGGSLAGGPPAGGLARQAPGGTGALALGAPLGDGGALPGGGPDGNPGGFGQPAGPGNNEGQPLGNGPQPGGTGSMDIGQPGALRLFLPRLNKEASWLLPFGLAGALLLLASAGRRWPLAPKHQTLVLWGGWLVIGGSFFSIAGFFHPYYLSMLAPPIAALFAIAVVELWRLSERHPWLAITLLSAAAAATLGFQVLTAGAFINNLAWQLAPAGLFAFGVLLLVVATATHKSGPMALAGISCVMGALLISPMVWSGLTAFNPSANPSLPSAYAGGSVAPSNHEGLQVNEALLDYLQPRTQGIYCLMAVPSSMQGADYVLATGRPVLYMGGFMGQDQVVTPDELAKMVLEGKLRFIYLDASGRDSGGNSNVSSWVASACQVVQGFGTATSNSGAPDGTTAGPQSSTNGLNRGPSGSPGGTQELSLYDCGS